MKKKYQVMLIVLGCLIVLIGLSYAYFVSTSKFNGNGASVNGTTVTIDSVGFNIEGSLEFNDLNILPGHQNVSKIKVTAVGNDDAISYKLVWEGTNTINTPLKYYVYKTTSDVTPSIACTKEIEQTGLTKIMYEACTNTNFESLGEVVATGEITNTSGSREFVLVNDEVIKGTSTGNIIYYYVVLEYPNLDTSQNIDMGGSFNGQVTVKKTDDSLADITILKMYKKTDTDYEQITTMPNEGYVLNSERSTCTNSAIPTISNGKVLVTNLTTKGTECNLYFDEVCIGACKTILSSYQSNGKVSTARNGAITVDTEMENDKLYSVVDDDGTSYVYAGTNPNNYVQFGGFWWRIIRINGDGSIRLIYNGTSSAATGVGTQINGATYKYSHKDAYWTSASDNAYVKDNTYVGYMYGTAGSSSYSATHANTNSSYAKQIVDSWYNTNLNKTGVKEKIDYNGTFCNDRVVDKTANSSYQGDGSGTTATIYAPLGRLASNGSYKTIQNPSLKCSQSNDVFTTSESSRGNKALTYPVGLITSDEVVLAGGFAGTARTFWLNTGQYYWTMSPSNFGGSYVIVFFVHSDGNLYSAGVFDALGVRPVINLKADTLFKAGGIGTSDNPFIVEGAE